jgi:PEP-CTERM motif
MRLFRPAIVAVCVLGGMGFAAVANAGAYTYNGYGFSGENVHITDTLLGVENEYGGAGLITLDGSSAIMAYCVDIADWLLSAGTYNSGVNPNLAGLSSFTGHSKLADITALIAHGTNFAAVQVAIWETEYGSNLTITPDDSGLRAVANTYLADLSGLWTVPAGITLLELSPLAGQTNQTLVYVSVIPEPGSIVLLGSAIAAIGYMRWRRRVRPKPCCQARAWKGRPSIAGRYSMIRRASREISTTTAPI